VVVAVAQLAAFAVVVDDGAVEWTLDLHYSLKSN
jgi:hypothetical protein